MTAVIMLLRQSLAGLRLLLALTVVLGVLYPAVVLAAGRVVPDRADGSPLRVDGVVVGSRLIGQPFAGDRWFLPRPPAAGDGYDPLSTGASNLGPENADLLATVRQRRAEVARREGVDPATVPADAVTASGSGVDPHISPAYAELQVARVAHARGLTTHQVRALVRSATAGRALGFIGAPAVNVAEVNAALATSAGGRGR